MLNQIKVQFYTSIKNKMWLFILLLTVFFTTVFTMATYSMKGQAISSELMQNLESLKYVDASEVTLIDYFQRIICSDAVVMFTSIFAAVFAVMEFQNGYIKNVWHTITNKSYLVISKYLVLAVHVLLSFAIVCTVVSLLNGGVMKCETVGNAGDFIRVLAVQFVLQISFCSIVIAMSLVIRKVLVGVIISVIYVVIAKSAIYKAVDLLIEKIFSLESFQIRDYLPYGNILNINTDSQTGDIIHALIVAGIFLAISTAVSIISLKKQDVC